MRAAALGGSHGGRRVRPGVRGALLLGASRDAADRRGALLHVRGLEDETHCAAAAGGPPGHGVDPDDPADQPVHGEDHREGRRRDAQAVARPGEQGRLAHHSVPAASGQCSRRCPAARSAVHRSRQIRRRLRGWAGACGRGRRRGRGGAGGAARPGGLCMGAPSAASGGDARARRRPGGSEPTRGGISTGTGHHTLSGSAARCGEGGGRAGGPLAERQAAPPAQR
mmetsp:Transcript_7669/g.23302  ORF Transcript_7669/g.23302 Transcript_7669/m.23302 type:complete len:225 (+) Transcript_7669:372-1046(+)